MTKQVKLDSKSIAKEANQALKKLFPDPQISLEYKTPLQLLVATILSAQCTDERVNKVTKDLFKKYKKTADYANANQFEFEEDIHSTGFYKNKAKSIINCCKQLVNDHGGDVPGNMDDLVNLAGVGRKTANVILGSAYGIPSIVVDTHVGRVSQRLALTKQKNADKIEQDLMELMPEKDWTVFSSRVILIGRNICKARKPICGECPLEKICPYDGKTVA